MRFELDKYLDVSAKVKYDDLDWEAARAVGLTENEKFYLPLFAEIESQTIVYFRDLLMTKVALDPEVIGFMSMWNYEEYFHGRALATFLAEMGHPMRENRIAEVRKSAGPKEMIELAGYSLLSYALDAHFPALFFSWGSTQEAMTMNGYEEISATTKNPALRILADRIAKQERRHFAYYFNSAKHWLAKSESAQRFARRMMDNFWTPVGTGALGAPLLRKMVDACFVGQKRQLEVAGEIDTKIQTLPGMQGLECVSRYIKNEQKPWSFLWNKLDTRRVLPAGG
jgi:hypothetical protein